MGSDEETETKDNYEEDAGNLVEEEAEVVVDEDADSDANVEN